MSETIHPHNVSVDHTSDNDIRLTLWVGDGLESVRVEVPLGDALTMLRDLANHVAYAVEDAMVDVKAGDCPRCRNVRLVQEPAPGGRTQQVRCPDCGPAFAAARQDIWARPRVRGGTR